MTHFELEDIQNVAELAYSWDKLNNKTILISGGTGFIGSFLTEVIRYRVRKYNSNTKVISLSRKGGSIRCYAGMCKSRCHGTNPL